MSMLWQCSALTYGPDKSPFCTCAMTSGLLYDAEHVRILLTTFRIAHRMYGMAWPISGGNPPC